MILYLPVILNPGLLLDRGNDLTEFFWPVFYFVKQQILEKHTFPLWNNLFLSGTPLLPDPQSPLFYLPNIIFLLFPIGFAFVMSLVIHTFMGGMGAYWLAKSGMKLSEKSAKFTALFYLLSPRLAGYLEAGHYGLVASLTWLPFVTLALLQLVNAPSLGWSFLMAIGLAGVYYTHTASFVVAVGATVLIFTGLMIFGIKKIKSIIYFGLGALLTFGLTAITLLPHLEWLPLTNRNLLTQVPDVYPKWQSVVEAVKMSIVPDVGVDTEKWLALGMVPLSLAFFGFLKLDKRRKILVTILLAVTGLVALNNASPLYDILLSQKWYQLLRVSTRVWFVAVMSVTMLAGFALEKIKKEKLARLLAVLAVIELVTLSWLRISKPSSDFVKNPPGEELYEYIARDSGLFRVFCVTRCIPQLEAAKHNLQLVEGYSTLSQMNYFKHSWQLTHEYWNYYTLSIPPMGIYKFKQPQPDTISLAQYNVKYIIAPYLLTDPGFHLEKKVGSYFIFKNTKWLPRAYFVNGKREFVMEADIADYSPNRIRVRVEKLPTTKLVLAEVYSPGWKAYLNGEEYVDIQFTPEALRFVDLKPTSKFVDFKYQPESFELGKQITLATISGVLLTLYVRRKNRVSGNSHI